MEDALLQAAFAVNRRKRLPDIETHLEKQEVHDELYKQNPELDRSDPENQRRVYQASMGLIKDGYLEIPDKSGQTLGISSAGIARAKNM